MPVVSPKSRALRAALSFRMASDSIASLVTLFLDTMP